MFGNLNFALVEPLRQTLLQLTMPSKSNMKRKIKTTKILNDSELALLQEAVPQGLRPNIAELMDRYGLSVESTIRFTSVRAQCKEARFALRLSIKESAKALRVPQSRLKDIEAGHLPDIQPEILQQYMTLLGLKSWFRRWRSKNKDLATELGVDVS